MGTAIQQIQPQQLKLYHEPAPFERYNQTTPNSYFVERYPWAFEQYGSPFIELNTAAELGLNIIPASINTDFFAAVLGGRKDLGHHTIYYEPEMHFYFRDSDGVFKPTSAEKLQNQYRALLMRCAQEMPANVNKLNLVNEFRSDRTVRAIVQRAKSALAADHTFFSATSPYQRIRGVELYERIARRFVDEMLCGEPDQVLLMSDAYERFLELLKHQNLEPVKRCEFKAMVTPLMKERFDVCLRNDLRIDDRRGVRGWKHVALVQAHPN
jgi:hypothetical protein